MKRTTEEIFNQGQRKIQQISKFIQISKERLRASFYPKELKNAVYDLIEEFDFYLSGLNHGLYTNALNQHFYLFDGSAIVSKELQVNEIYLSDYRSRQSFLEVISFLMKKYNTTTKYVNHNTAIITILPPFSR